MDNEQLKREVALCGADYAMTQLPHEFQRLTPQQIKNFLGRVILNALETHEDLRTYQEGNRVRHRRPIRFSRN